VIDNVFGVDFCKEIKKEIQSLYDTGCLYLNKTYYEGRKEEGKFTYSYSVAKPNIYELDLIDSNRQSVPYLNNLYQDKTLMNRLNELLPTMSLDCLDIKVQFNRGDGGCFPMHFDTTQTVSRRQITCILYLNEDWEEGVGGELRIFPFPYKHIDIAPLMDRLVVFSSHEVLHRVLPSYLPRYCITLWYEGSLSPNHILPGDFPWLSQNEELNFIIKPENRKSLSKLIYAEEWERSIILSFGQKEEVKEIVKKHRENVSEIRKKLGETLVGFLISHLPLSHSEEFFSYLNPSLITHHQ